MKICELHVDVNDVNDSQGLPQRYVHYRASYDGSGLPLNKRPVELAVSEIGCFQQVKRATLHR